MEHSGPRSTNSSQSRSRSHGPNHGQHLLSARNQAPVDSCPRTPSVGPQPPSFRITAAPLLTGLLTLQQLVASSPKSLPGLQGFLRPGLHLCLQPRLPLLHPAGHMGLPTAPGRRSAISLTRSHSAPGGSPPCLVPALPSELSRRVTSSRRSSRALGLGQITLLYT